MDPWKWILNWKPVLRPERSVEGLILALDDPKRRPAAAEALIRLGMPALRPLRKSLDDGSQGVFAAGLNRDHVRMGRVLDSLRVRVEVLKRIPDRRNLRHLMTMLAGATDLLERFASLWFMASDLPIAEARGLQEAAKAAMIAIGAPAVQPVTRAIQLARVPMRTILQEVLDGISGAQAASAREQLLRDHLLSRELFDRLLDPRNGLLCLPNSTKMAIRQKMRGQSDYAVEQFARERLSFLQEHIEPLAGDTRIGGHPEFRALCQALSSAESLLPISLRLKVAVRGTNPFSNWQAWAEQLTSNPTSSLYCLTNCWALSGDTNDSWGLYNMPEVEEARLIAPMAQAVDLLGRTGSAIGIIEHWLRTPWSRVYDSPLRMQKELERSTDHRSGELITSVIMLENLLESFHASLHGSRPHPLLSPAEGEKPPFEDRDDPMRRVDADRCARMLESWLEVPFHRFAAASPLQLMPPVTRLHVVEKWLRAVGPAHPDSLRTCEAVVEYVRTVRDSQLRSYQERQEFLRRVRSIWRCLQAIGLVFADAARRENRGVEAAELDLRLLAWAEQFENRLLLDRMQETHGVIGVDGASLLAGWRPGHWPLSRFGKPPTDRFGDGYLPPSDPFAWPQAALGVLESSIAVPVQADAPQRSAAQAAGKARSRQEQLAEQATQDRPLEDLIPQGAVWLRTLFDQDGALRWWAWGRPEGHLELLAQGVGPAGAERRLWAAVLDFDLRVEHIWAHHQRSWIGQQEKQLLTFLAECVADDNYAEEQLRTTDPGRDARIEKVQRTINSIRSTRPLLAELGRLLLERLLHSKERGYAFSAELVGVWERAVSGLDEEPWSEPRESPEGEARRRRELDGASRKLAAATGRELDLSQLWSTTRGKVDWQQADVLFQVQGPLLISPLAWLDFGGWPLFKQVASTSAVVSLMLRDVAEHEAKLAGEPGRRLLSAQWLEESDWEKMHGLAHLQAGLQRTCEKHTWEVWGLGQEPKASAENLRAATSRHDGPFGIIAVGGHGRREQAGVALADGVWRGDGIELSRVDWLILVACAVGRLEQQGRRDVEGLYAQLVVHRSRSVMAARWPIADTEAATFVTEVVHQYLNALARNGGLEPFARARALNRARSKLLDGVDQRFRVSTHLASAFEIYGLG